LTETEIIPQELKLLLSLNENWNYGHIYSSQGEKLRIIMACIIKIN